MEEGEIPRDTSQVDQEVLSDGDDDLNMKKVLYGQTAEAIGVSLNFFEQHKDPDVIHILHWQNIKQMIKNNTVRTEEIFRFSYSFSRTFWYEDYESDVGCFQSGQMLLFRISFVRHAANPYLPHKFNSNRVSQELLFTLRMQNANRRIACIHHINRVDNFGVS